MNKIFSTPGKMSYILLEQGMLYLKLKLKNKRYCLIFSSSRYDSQGHFADFRKRLISTLSRDFNLGLFVNKLGKFTSLRVLPNVPMGQYEGQFYVSTWLGREPRYLVKYIGMLL